MANNRIFYAIQAVGIGTSPINTGTLSSVSWIKGVQSVGVTTNFNLEQAFELGQLEVYQNIENIPEIEVTIEKVIDGYTPLYVAAGGGTNIVTSADSVSDVVLAIYPDTNSSASGTGSNTLLYCSGMFISNIAYTFPVEGNSTESITLVGNDKKFYSATGLSIATGFTSINAAVSHSPNANVARRQHFVPASSSIPIEVSGAIRNGSGNIQNISISADFGRENILELGKFRPYYKFASYPVSVTCDFEVVSTNGDRVSASGDSTNLPSSNAIKVHYNMGGTTLEIDLGSKNKLTSVNYTGGDTGGGNATVTYSYQTFNKLSVAAT